MRTTVDIPEQLLRRARARAALDGTRMKDVVNEALHFYLGGDGDREVGENLPDRVEFKQLGCFNLPLIRSPRPGKSEVTPEMLKAAEGTDDQDRHASIFGY